MNPILSFQRLAHNIAVLKQTLAGTSEKEDAGCDSDVSFALSDPALPLAAGISAAEQEVMVRVQSHIAIKRDRKRFFIKVPPFL